jgi:hypothetical protein
MTRVLAIELAQELDRLAPSLLPLLSRYGSFCRPVQSGRHLLNNRLALADPQRCVLSLGFQGGQMLAKLVRGNGLTRAQQSGLGDVYADQYE